MGNIQSYKNTDWYERVNQHDILGQGGFGTVYSDRESDEIAYKLIFSRADCNTAIEESKIQEHVANTLNGILSTLPIPVYIPRILGYSDHACTFCEVPYSCILAMDRVPFFNPNIRVAYQLAMEIDKPQEHHNDEGIKIYTTRGYPRGMFINETYLQQLTEKYGFNIQSLGISWGYTVAALIFLAHNDINDLEYILTQYNGYTYLCVVDFGLSKTITEPITIETLDHIFQEHITLDIVLPSETNTIIFPHFIAGIHMFSEHYPQYTDLSNHLVALFKTK